MSYCAASASYHVKYVLGGREKKVAATRVRSAEDLDAAVLVSDDGAAGEGRGGAEAGGACGVRVAKLTRSLERRACGAMATGGGGCGVGGGGGSGGGASIVAGSAPRGGTDSLSEANVRARVDQWVRNGEHFYAVEASLLAEAKVKGKDAAQRRAASLRAGAVAAEAHAEEAEAAAAAAKKADKAAASEAAAVAAAATAAAAAAAAAAATVEGSPSEGSSSEAPSGERAAPSAQEVTAAAAANAPTADAARPSSTAARAATKKAKSRRSAATAAATAAVAAEAAVEADDVPLPADYEPSPTPAPTNVLHLDGLVNKLEAGELAYLFDQISARGTAVQVAYVQGAVAFEGEAFEHLLRFVRQGDVWAMNLGEVFFNRDKLEQLEQALKESSVTHLFYEDVGEWKESFRNIIRDNRKKHQRWVFSADRAQNAVITMVNKCWFNPINHSCNKEWMERHEATRSSAAMGGGAAGKGRGRGRGRVTKDSPEMAVLPRAGVRILYQIEEGKFEGGKVLKRASGLYFFEVQFDFGQRLQVKIQPKTLGEVWKYEPLKRGDKIAYKFNGTYFEGTIYSKHGKWKDWWVVDFRNLSKLSVQCNYENIGQAWHLAGCVKAKGDQMAWTQCVRCNKWRKLPDGIEEWPDATFFCEMNHWDKRFNACAKEQERGSNDSDAEDVEDEPALPARKSRTLDERHGTEEAFFMKNTKVEVIGTTRSGRQIMGVVAPPSAAVIAAEKKKAVAKEKAAQAAANAASRAKAKAATAAAMPPKPPKVKKPPNTDPKREDAFFNRGSTTITVLSRTGRVITRVVPPPEPKGKTVFPKKKKRVPGEKDASQPQAKKVRSLSERVGQEDAFFVKKKAPVIAGATKSGRLVLAADGTASGVAALFGGASSATDALTMQLSGDSDAPPGGH